MDPQPKSAKSETFQKKLFISLLLQVFFGLCLGVLSSLQSAVLCHPPSAMLASKNLAARGLRGQAAAGLRRMSTDNRSMSSSANRDTTVYGQGTSTTFTVEKKSHLTMRDIGEKIPIPTVHKFSPPPRLLCGPGPGNAHPRVHAAMSLPQVGHLDPYFLELMEDIKALLRYTYQTKNEFTVPVSGTGSAAMEACVANMVEPGDKILVGVNGYFGHRMINMAKRYGGEPIAINKPWGQVFTYEEIKAAIEKHQPKIVGLIHAETSTGACQPFDGVAELCRKHGAILIADCVTSISGVPLYIDEWGIDASYAGTQKALSCPPGVSPLTFGPRAMEKLMSRKTDVANWYLDMKMIASYIGGAGGGGPRSYHHTAPISMCYAMREALELVREEVLFYTFFSTRIFTLFLCARRELEFVREDVLFFTFPSPALPRNHLDGANVLAWLRACESLPRRYPCAGLVTEKLPRPSGRQKFSKVVM